MKRFVKKLKMCNGLWMFDSRLEKAHFGAQACSGLWTTGSRHKKEGIRRTAQKVNDTKGPRAF